MSQQSVAKLYQSVIDEVIESMRETVADEGLDEQILIELKQLWEQKLHASKALDATPIPVVSNHMSMMSQGATNHAQAIRRPIPQQQPQRTIQLQPVTRPQSQPLDMSGAAVSATMALPPLYQQQLLAGGIQLQQTSSGALAAVIPASAIQSGAISLPPNAILRPQQPQQLLPQDLSNKLPGQLDGTDDTDEPVSASGTTPAVSNTQDDNGAASSGASSSGASTSVRPKIRKKSREIEVIIQLDGNDTSSEDDDDLDDSADEETAAAEEEHIDEEPLNSDDDVSGDEQTSMADPDNIVVCQYDKITRSKNRWRFNLKDGIMNINGRDYVFQKAIGEAEW